MKYYKKLGVTFKAFQELGLSRTGHYALYQVALRTGWINWKSQRELHQVEESGTVEFSSFFELPKREFILQVVGENTAFLISEADRSCGGEVQIFGQDWTTLNYSQTKPLVWFSELELEERKQSGGKSTQNQDIKPIWEVARFGWAYILGRAYWVTGDERYSQAFWDYWEQFNQCNPPYYGYNWLSGQEVAFRIIAWAFSYRIFQNSPHTTLDRKVRLQSCIAEHAARIPCTLDYSQAQNNNHLLSESAGLLTAALCLPDHPKSKHWRNMGWYWFNWGIQHQIQKDGAYLQHSCNYHRLMLQLALWVNLIIRQQPVELPSETRQKLAKATLWLWEVTEASTGKVPNFGPNDGALIQPLSVAQFEDYRPVLQAAGRAFLGAPLFDAGIWDEMSLWYGFNWEDGEKLSTLSLDKKVDFRDRKNSIVVLRPKESPAWASIRCTHFHNRPGHADQLHAEFWWHGFNIAKDAGTYLYTAAPPWDNALAETFYHNTLTINQTNQMEKAGRFLWINWAQGKIVDYQVDESSHPKKIIAEHNGYRKWHLIHRRSLEWDGKEEWFVADELLSLSDAYSKHNPAWSVRLHWLLADFPWEIENKDGGWRIQFQTPVGSFWIEIISPQVEHTQLSLIRGGIPIYGNAQVGSPYGWFSPTYAKLEPAISLIVDQQTNIPGKILTVFKFPAENKMDEF